MMQKATMMTMMTMMTMTTQREAKKEKAKARARKARAKKSRGEEMMRHRRVVLNLLQLVPTVIAENVWRSLQKARQLRPAMTHATAILHAKALASGQARRPRGIAHCLMRPAVVTASAVGILLLYQ